MCFRDALLSAQLGDELVSATARPSTVYLCYPSSEMHAAHSSVGAISLACSIVARDLMVPRTWRREGHLGHCQCMRRSLRCAEKT